MTARVSAAEVKDLDEVSRSRHIPPHPTGWPGEHISSHLRQEEDERNTELIPRPVAVAWERCPLPWGVPAKHQVASNPRAMETRENETVVWPGIRHSSRERERERAREKMPHTTGELWLPPKQ